MVSSLTDSSYCAKECVITLTSYEEFKRLISSRLIRYFDVDMIRSCVVTLPIIDVANT